jgi:hypothetical protein
MFQERFFRRMNEAGAGGLGDGGAGAAGGASGAGGEGAAGTTGGSTPPVYSGPEFAKDWGIDPEIANDPSLAVFKSPADLAKSYVHTKKEVGKKGVLIPSDNAPKEEWDQFWAKAGVPLEEAKYKESFKAPEKSELPAEFTDGFLKLAHEARLRPDAASKVLNYVDSQVKAESQKVQQQQVEQMQGELNKLMETMGTEAYNVKLAKTTNFLKEAAGDEFVQFLGKTGLGSNATVVKHLMAIADKYGKEGEIPPGDSSYGMTKADIQREINLVHGNFEDPYHKPNHPDHQRRVAEVQGYYKKLEQK